MAQDWFDEATKPVSAPTQRRGQIIRDPYRESDESRKDAANRRAEEDQRFEQQRLALEAERTRLSAEAEDRQRFAAETGNIPEGMRLVNGRLEAIPGFEGRITNEDRGKLQGQLSGATGRGRRIQEIEQRFNRDFSGKSLSEYLPGQLRPANQEFNDAGRALMGDLAAAFGLTAQQQNTPAELEIRFGPFIPRAGDRDEVIASKIARLKEIARAQATQAGGRLGKDISDILAPLETPQLDAVTPTSVANQLGGVGRPVVNPDGTVTVREADGTQSLYPDQATYAQAMARARGTEEGGLGFNVTDESPNVLDNTRDTLGGGIDAVVRGAADTLSLGLAEPLNAGLNSILGGGSFSDELARERQVTAADERVNPWLRMGGQFAGAIPMGYGLARAGAAAVPSRPMLGIAGAETAGGATYGGVSTPEDPLVGAILGGAGGLVGSQIGQRVIAPAMNAIATRGVPRGLQRYARSAPTEAMEEANTLLADAQRLGVPMGLADTSSQARTLAGSATRMSPNARAYAEEVIRPRGLAQQERAIDAIARDLAQPVNMIDERAAIRQTAQRQSQPLYEAAFGRPAPVDADIDAMLATPAGRTALQQAVNIARNEGRDPTALGFDLNELGEVVTVRNPSFETLHMVKRGLDSVVEGSRSATGVLNREDPAVAAIDGLRARFRTRLGELDDNYGAANSAYAAQMRNRDALDFGYSAVAPGVNANTVADAATRMPIEPMQRGYASGMVNQIEGVRNVSNPFEAVYGTPRQQQKVAQLFPEGAGDFARQNEIERLLAQTQYETLGGSPTAGRRAADELLSPALGGQIAGETALGMMTGVPPIGAATQALRAGLGDRVRMGFGGQEMADDIARLLLNPDTAAAIEALNSAMGIRAVRDANSRLGAGLGGSLVIPFAGGE